MLRDASSETHSIVLNVEDPTDVRALFDGITYHKGAGILHMLYEYLGGEHGLFFKRIKKYLLKYKFKNANTQELFHELGGNKIINMMNSWVKQPGLPLIKIECNIINKNKLHFILTQERIRPNIGSGERISNEQVWEIPIKILDSSGVHNDLDLMRDTSVCRYQHMSETYGFNSVMVAIQAVL
eukprot:534322_1